MKHINLFLFFAFLLVASCGAPPPNSLQTTTNQNPIPTSFDYPPIEDYPITELENPTSNIFVTTDQVQPQSNIDGVVAELAPILDLTENTSNCRMAQGYNRGKPHAICVVTVQGKILQVDAAIAFQHMATAARNDGVELTILSGYRTMNQQRQIYQSNNSMANPGYSNHQSGMSLDIESSANTWLQTNAATYGFYRTVPAEPWHWEWFQGRTLLSANPDACYSSTLNRYVPVNTCVQSRDDTRWYTCWGDGTWNLGMLNCSHTFSLVAVRPRSVFTTCYSTTLVREVPLNTCVRSEYDHQPYVCSMTSEYTTGWVGSPGGC